MRQKPLVNGAIIKASRRRMGWSQSELSIKSGVPQSLISRLETEREPYDCKISNIIALASTLSLPLHSLVYLDHPNEDIDFPTLEPTLSAMIKVLASVTDRQQHQAALILDGFMTGLLYEDHDELRFTDVHVSIRPDED